MNTATIYDLAAERQRARLAAVAAELVAIKRAVAREAALKSEALAIMADLGLTAHDTGDGAISVAKGYAYARTDAKACEAALAALGQPIPLMPVTVGDSLKVTPK
jgi:hypothetical protein